ncbi:hypothetical protein GCM10010954_19550 [Halobacillus andaensis]|uniref:Deacetylase PdaC domain-containing protein n=1 Tax=Halobacillus andaensis TaxID=1176239 RepID=A0A917EXI1_HALAA|nr:hypothetical protein [Halobacillus andaensis]MBP2004539.1 hypothetical protein [Halobacillus andaensis]GGF20895.1 hypothetical protein GCM10010954_19550 [Halobacillus andaensis]
MNSFNIYLSILSVVLLTACSFMIADANDAQDSSSNKQEPYSVTSKKEMKDIEEYQYSIEFPQTPNDQIDQSIIDYVNQLKDTFKKESYEAKVNRNNHQKHSLAVGYDVLFEDEQVFVVKFTEVMEMGENVSRESQTVLNFDKSNGKRLDLNHIFTEDAQYLETLTKLANEKVKGSFEESTAEDNFRNLALKGNRIEVHLTPQEQEKVGAESDRIFISKTDLEDMMRPRYAEIRSSWVDE